MSPRSIAAAAFSLLALAGPLPAHAVDPLPPSYVYAGAATSADFFLTLSAQNEELLFGSADFANAAVLPFAQARTSFGTNEALADVTSDTTMSTYAAGFSIWQDSFTVTGGTGTGMANVSISLTGAFGPADGAAMNFALLSLSAPLSTEAQIVAFVDDLLGTFAAPSGTQIVLADFELSSFPPEPTITLTGQYEFTYGEPFYLLSMMSAVAFWGGSVDYLGTAVFGITAPGSITTASDAVYAAAVPEPGTWATLVAGLLALALLGRARRRALVGSRRRA